MIISDLRSTAAGSFNIPSEVSLRGITQGDTMGCKNLSTVNHCAACAMKLHCVRIWVGTVNIGGI